MNRCWERLGGGTRLSTLAPHPTIDASTRGRGRIAHRSAELGYGRTAVDVVWIRDEKCPFMPAEQRDEFAPFQLFDISSRPARRAWQDAFSRIKLHGSAARLGSE